jgi:predicted membrane-bound spermidine synthase
MARGVKASAVRQTGRREAEHATAEGRRLVGSLTTAFLTGLAGILVEVVGARALAPYFGSSLMVWTAQITATLLFLALGYEFGGRISRSPSRSHLPMLLFVAASWLVLYPALRAPVLGMSSTLLGVAAGSFLSAVMLFGVPLLCIGTVSPVLISYIDESRPGAGSAAGSLFFISTLGGLAGGWIAVFVVIPYLSVRLCMVGTGVVLALIGVTWSYLRRSQGAATLCAGALVAGLAIAIPPSSDIVRTSSGLPVRLLYSRQSEVGLIRVIDAPAYRPLDRALHIDGSVHGGIFLSTGKPYLKFVDQLDTVGQIYQPKAKDALILGLGAGLLARALSDRGLRVTAVELDPQVVYVARKFFALPAAIKVTISDARSFLRADRAQFDLIYLDTFTGGNMPWYLTTTEAFRDMRARLRPHGLLVSNAITNEHADSPGITRLEAGIRAVFPDIAVFLGEGNRDLFNATVVAGAHLEEAPQASVDPAELQRVPLAPALASGLRPGTDDSTDIDYADVTVQEKERQMLIADFGLDILGD